MRLQEGLREQTLQHLLEPTAHQRQEHARDNNVIAWLGHSGHLAPAQHRHAARNVAYGHLVAVLLHLQLLELDELGATRLQVQPAARLVHATIIRGTVVDGRKGERVHGLIGLGAAAIARVGGHHHHGFHLSAASHNAAYSDQFANMLGLHLAYGVGLLRGLGLEANLAESMEKEVKVKVISCVNYTYNLFISSEGKLFLSSRCSMGFRVRASIMRRCSMYTSRASLACTSCCL